MLRWQTERSDGRSELDAVKKEGGGEFWGESVETVEIRE